MKELITVLAAALALAGCSSGPDRAPDMKACDAFAYYVTKADSVATMDRGTTVEQVNMELGDSKGMVRDAADGLERTKDGPTSGWQLAADTFAQTCMDAGWTKP